MPYLGISWLKFLKTIVIFEIGTFKFIKNEFLAHAVNFCIGPDFTFGPGSVFLKVRFLVQVWFIKYVQFGGIKPLFSSIIKHIIWKTDWNVEGQRLLVLYFSPVAKVGVILLINKIIRRVTVPAPSFYEHDL